MRRMLPLFAAASLAALAACSKPAGGPAPPVPPAAADSASATRSEAADAAPAATAPGPAENAAPSESADVGQPAASRLGPPPTPRMPMLAMAYRLSLVSPADQVRGLMESHQEACELAGPAQCQVLGAELKSEGRDRQSATLSLRATPAWMRAFRTRAEADAKGAGGRVRETSTAGEDLSRPIGDSEAAQRQLAAEKERLAELLQRRTHHLDDSLAIEQEITRVQQEIDAQDSALEAMQDRVAMQTLNVEYASTGMAFDGDAAPLARAGQHFGRNVLAVFAALVEIGSFLTPFVLIGAPIAWFFRSRLKKPTPKPAPSPQNAS